MLELTPEVLESRDFQRVNPDYVEGSPCLYVGETSHLPKCRASAHTHCKPGDWRGKEYTCYCEDGRARKTECTLGSRGSKTVDDFNTGRLPAKLFRGRNPQQNRTAGREAELQLALELREKGCGVWAGHHDKKS